MSETVEKNVTADALGIQFGEPPAPPRKNERDDDLWQGVKYVLTGNKENHGKWAKVKTWNRPERAGQVASAINNNKNKMFPAEQGWEARYESERKQDKSGSSSLWLCYTPKKGSRGGQS